MTETRNRIVNPSINFPESEEEAFQAVLHRVRKSLFEGNPTGRSPLDQTYTTNAGLGHTRTQESADWLNAQQALIRARLEDLLDELDITNRIALTSD